MNKTRIVLPLLAVTLGACSLAPDYTRPALPVAADWPAATAVAGARSIVALEWKDFFPDPRLQALIATALDNNRDMRVAVARVSEARALYGIQDSSRLPKRGPVPRPQRLAPAR